MIFSNVLAQCFLLSETLPTVLATESLFAFVNGLVSFKSSTRHKALTAAFLLTDVFSLKSMDGFDVLLQVLVLYIVLIATIIRALKWSRIGVRIEVIS